MGIDSPLENEDTSTQTRKLLHGKSPLVDGVDRRLDAGIAARSSTTIGLPCGSAPMLGSVIGSTFKKGNGVDKINRSSFPRAENLHNFSTRKATAESYLREMN